MAPRSKKQLAVAPPPDTRIRFSFAFYDVTTGKYCLSRADQEQVKQAMGRLRELSEKTYNELITAAHNLRFHPIDWSQTRERNGYPDTRANAFDPFQVALLNVNGQKARLYGAYSAGTFYIVWFDLDHYIWPSFKKHT